MKQLIKQIENEIKTDSEKKSRHENDKEGEEIQLDKESATISINSNLIVSSKKNLKYSDKLNSFLQAVDVEIKKVFRSYLNKERELYLMTNSHLHIRNNYENFNCEHLIKELNELVKISVFILKLENFVNLNLIGLRKILKKFDKKFDRVFGKISLKYLVKKLEGNNSDLLYILQFKMIDESSSILDDLLMEIESRFTEAFKILKSHKNKNIDAKNQSIISMKSKENVLNANLLDNEVSINDDEIKTTIDINKTTSKLCPVRILNFK